MKIWKHAVDLVEKVYKMTENFPDNEKYCLTNQIRKCAVSIPSNISEGAARKSDKEFLNFINIALGSLAELETQYIIAERLKYTEEKTLYEDIEKMKSLIIGLRNYLLNKQK
ncbi:MAG: four helix bundle protein [Ignavibacteria bacterium]|nr:four helix bundle protein [Ignavibacteria bacterium]